MSKTCLTAPWDQNVTGNMRLTRLCQYANLFILYLVSAYRCLYLDDQDKFLTCLHCCQFYPIYIIYIITHCALGKQYFVFLKIMTE
jgi:hypothetical protein